MKKIPILRTCFAVFLAAAVLCSTLPTAARASTSAEIQEELDALEAQNDELQTQIDALQEQYDANATKIETLVSNKNAVDQQIALLYTQIDNINTQIATYSQLIADNQDELEATEDYLSRLNEQSKERIRAMEEDGTISYWEVIFRSEDFTDMLDRLNMIEEIAAADQERLDAIESAASMIRKLQQEQKEQKDALEESQAELTESEAELEAKRTESDEILRELAERQEEYQELLEQSEELQNELLDEIAQKEKEYSAAKYKEELVQQALKGENPASDATWLVPLAVNYVISSPFGNRLHPIYKIYKMHKGIDMGGTEVVTGTPIYATRAGTVTIATYNSSAGNYVSINHGDGFSSVYMHMSRYVVSAGQTVSAGQLIGYVGSTGSSTAPHLHFGISYGGVYVNPLAYIG